MMKKEIINKSGKLGFADPSYYYLLIIAGIVFAYMSFCAYTRVLYEHCLIIPCLMLLGALQERGTGLKCKKNLMLPYMMVAWFLILQIKRSIEHAELDNIGLFLATYLFAFPLASLLQDGDKKKALYIFAGAYLAAASVLAADGLLLVLDCLPGFLSEHVFWTGARLEAFWHPNVAACFLMIGIVFCTTFLSQAKSRRSKLGLGVLLIMIGGALALTSCRTAIILTSGYLGAILFFGMIKHGRKWFLPGILAAAVLVAAFYMGAGRLYQANYDMLMKKYIQQYSEQLTSRHADNETIEAEISSAEITEPEKADVNPASAETEPVSEHEVAEAVPETDAAEETYYEEEYDEEEYDEEDPDDIQEESIPIAVDPETGEIYLTTDSPQGSIGNDFGTLNNRTYIWSAARFAIRETPSILFWGMLNPGRYVSYYFFKPIGHLHNAWMECLVGMGVVGFSIAMLFTLITLWNILIILLKHHQDTWKRNIALLTLCLMVASVLEPYLFYTTVEYHLVDLLFFLCAGYLAHWQEEDNRHLLAAVRSKIPFLK